MQKNRKRTDDVVADDPRPKKDDNAVAKGSPVSISVCYNRNGVQEIYVLYSDGSIKVKRDDSGWQQIGVS
jgi:hypothetical protein